MLFLIMGDFSMSYKILLAAGFIAVSVVSAAADGHEKVLSPAALEQVNIANKLVALGNAKRDALLLIAAAHLRANISDDAVGTPQAVPSTADVLADAKKYAGGRKDYLGMIEDIAAAKSKGCSVRYGCQNPYLK
ncbi:MAG: hypothetical protein ABJM29_00020 [Rhizobiaceae bacterium]